MVFLNALYHKGCCLVNFVRLCRCHFDSIILVSDTMIKLESEFISWIEYF